MAKNKVDDMFKDAFPEGSPGAKEAESVRLRGDVEVDRAYDDEFIRPWFEKDQLVKTGGASLEEAFGQEQGSMLRRQAELLIQSPKMKAQALETEMTQINRGLPPTGIVGALASIEREQEQAKALGTLEAGLPPDPAQQAMQETEFQGEFDRLYAEGVPFTEAWQTARLKFPATMEQKERLGLVEEPSGMLEYVPSAELGARPLGEAERREESLRLRRGREAEEATHQAALRRVREGPRKITARPIDLTKLASITNAITNRMTEVRLAKGVGGPKDWQGTALDIVKHAQEQALVADVEYTGPSTAMVARDLHSIAATGVPTSTRALSSAYASLFNITGEDKKEFRSVVEDLVKGEERSDDLVRILKKFGQTDPNSIRAVYNSLLNLGKE